jgi:hypothetical protein
MAERFEHAVVMRAPQLVTRDDFDAARRAGPRQRAVAGRDEERLHR